MARRLARTFYWNELMTRDVERAKKFYADTFGWSFDAMPMPAAAPIGSPRPATSRSAASSTSAAREFDGVPESWMSYSRSTTSTRAWPEGARPAPS